MVSSKNIVLSSLFFFLYFVRTFTCQKVCPSVQCRVAGNEQVITYPFGNTDLQGAGCGYPGFNLTCDDLGNTVLKLPPSEEFLVRKIDYVKKEIRLYDRNNCLAKRLLKVHLPPFKAYEFRIYHFFSCPPSITTDPVGRAIAVIPCLSNTTNIVLVVGSSNGEFDSHITEALTNGGCRITLVTIPIPSTTINKISPYDFRTDDLFLTWVEPKKSEGSNEPKGQGKKVDVKKWAIIIGSLIASLLGLLGLGTLIRCINNSNNTTAGNVTHVTNNITDNRVTDNRTDNRVTNTDNRVLNVRNDNRVTNTNPDDRVGRVRNDSRVTNTNRVSRVTNDNNNNNRVTSTNLDNRDNRVTSTNPGNRASRATNNVRVTNTNPGHGASRVRNDNRVTNANLTNDNRANHSRGARRPADGLTSS